MFMRNRSGQIVKPCIISRINKVVCCPVGSKNSVKALKLPFLIAACSDISHWGIDAHTRGEMTS